MRDRANQLSPFVMGYTVPNNMVQKGGWKARNVTGRRTVVAGKPAAENVPPETMPRF